MSELGDLLELLHGAGSSFQTVETRWRCWRHDERVHAAFVVQHTGSLSVAGASAAGSVRPPEHEEEVRLWFARPDRMREEHDGDATLTVRVGSTWWAYSPRMGAMTNDGDERHQHGIGQMFEPLLDPARVMGLFDIEITGGGERAGRIVECSVWRPRRLSDHDRFALHRLGSGAQEHAIEVDAKRGVLLRNEARFGGRPMAIVEALDVTFDAELDPELFRSSHQLGRSPTGWTICTASTAASRCTRPRRWSRSPSTRSPTYRPAGS